MSKVVYYRITDPETKRQKWVRLPGVKTDGNRLIIHPNFWNLSKDPFQVLYTRSKIHSRELATIPAFVKED